MTKKDALNFVLLTGKILLENGAETWRIEDTMERILNSFNIGSPEVFVTTTGLFASIDEMTLIKRIRYRTINMSKISMVNDLSRKIVGKEISFEEAKIKIQEIENFKGYPKFIGLVFNGFAGSFSTLLFGGNSFDALNSFLAGFILRIFLDKFNEKKLQNFLCSFFGAVIVSINSLIILKIGIGNDIDKIITGSIMPLAPGLAITNAIRDIFHGDFISGSGRAFDALICAIAIATGVGIALTFFVDLLNIFIW